MTAKTKNQANELITGDEARVMWVSGKVAQIVTGEVYATSKHHVTLWRDGVQYQIERRAIIACTRMNRNED